MKRKHDQGINNLSCDGENGQIGESLSKYQRTDEIHSGGLSSASHEHQMSIHSSQSDQQTKSCTQSDSMSNENITTTAISGSNGHFVGDTSRSSPLLSASGTHNSEAFQNANRVASPNSRPLPPTEFKQESHSVAVTCDGVRNMRNAGPPRDTLPNGIGLTNSTRSSTESKSADSVAGQELQQQINDFERVLLSISNSDMYKNTAMNQDMSTQHHQLTRQTASQMDPGSRDSINTQQPNVQNSSNSQQNPYTTPPSQGPPGPTALHLQQLARQAQSQRANAGYMEGQEQDPNQYKSQQMQYMEAFRFATPGSQQQQLQNQNTMQSAQFSATSRYRGSMATGTDQYGNMYSSKDQNHNVIMSTGFPSAVSPQYQRMIQTQVQQQQQQQAMYSRMTQQGMPQRLSHPSIPEHQQTYSPYQPHQNMPQSQYNGMNYQNTAGYQNVRANQGNFQRQMSMPAQGFHEQYSQQSMNQYQLGEQQAPNQSQQTDLSSTSYHNYNRRNSFPLYHRSMSQPSENYGPTGPHPGGNISSATAPHPGYPMNQMRTNMPGANPGNPMIDTRNNPPVGYSNYSNRTSFASQTGLQGMLHLSQRNGPAMSQAAAMQPRTDQQSMSYGSNMRDSNTQNIQQDMKYPPINDISKTTRGPSFNDPLDLTSATPTSNTDSHYNPFSSLGSLEKAPSFASLLDQQTGSLNNLETTYTGSIPNLDLLGEIIG